MTIGTWLRAVKDGLIQDDPNPEPSWLDRLDCSHPAGATTESRPIVQAPGQGRRDKVPPDAGST